MIKVYTDGSCRKAQEEGGWAYVVLDADENIIKEDKGYCSSTTSQNEEIRALCNAMSWTAENIQPRQQIKIFSDSKYGVNGINSWMHNWVKNDWKTTKKTTVAHVDYWQCIYKNHKKHEFKVKHVRAHNGNYWNEHVDSLAIGTWKKPNIISKTK
jgi:ribonuclease HI